MNRSTSFVKTARTLIAILFWLIVWQGVSMKIGKPLLMPSPAEVFSRFLEIGGTLLFWKTTLVSILRILQGHLIGLVLGIALAVICFYSKVLSTILSPAIRAIRATPVVSFIILMWVWFSSEKVPVLIVSLMVMPVIWQEVLSGFENTDSKLLEMADFFQFGTLKKLRHLYIPSALPYLIGGIQSTMGLAWKSGIAAEVISTPKIAIGRELEEGKVYLETADVFLWTIVVILLSLLLEKAVRMIAGKRGKQDD